MNKYLISNLDTPTYFPINKGLYEVKPGLHNLGADFGNDILDHAVLQVDRNYCEYRAGKLHARYCSLEKYYQIHKFPRNCAQASLEFLISHAVTKYGQFFSTAPLKNRGIKFSNHITGEQLELSEDYTLTNASGPDHGPQYVSAFDAIALQIQEDIAVLTFSPDGQDYLCALHLCFPNHWSAQEKIGKDFSALHHPVPGIDRILSKSKKMLQAILHTGPYVRFAWGLTTDSHLDHHPVRHGNNLDLTYCTQFNRIDPHLYLRVERQTITGLPQANCIIFTIKTYITDCRYIKTNLEQNKLLQNALQSMSPSTLLYKGLANSVQDILEWLKSDA